MHVHSLQRLASPLKRFVSASRRFGLGWLPVFLSTITLSPITAQAEWMTATGRAEIHGGQYDEARRMAQEDALRQISWRSNASVSSESRMEQGRLTLDRVSVQGNAQVRGVRVIDEQVRGDLMTLTLVADVVAAATPTCAAGTANSYRKQVAMLAFAIQSPEQSLIGRLDNLERALPATLAQALNDRGHVLALEASHLRLYNELVNAPSVQTERQTLAYAVQAAKSLGAQFVVSGVIRDLRVRSPEHFQRTVWNDALRGIGMRDTERAFAIDVFVHDGFSGDVIYQQRYQTSGNWHASPESAVPFGSDAFWRMEYGKAVQQLLFKVVADVDEHLRCMPFMTRITRVSGEQLQFNSGANNGVRVGDELRVYRTAEFHDAQLLQGTEFKDVNLMMKVTQIQPGFAQGRIHVDGGRVNIQPDDVLIAW